MLKHFDKGFDIFDKGANILLCKAKQIFLQEKLEKKQTGFLIFLDVCPCVCLVVEKHFPYTCINGTSRKTMGYAFCWGGACPENNDTT